MFYFSEIFASHATGWRRIVNILFSFFYTHVHYTLVHQVGGRKVQLSDRGDYLCSKLEFCH